MALYDLLIKTKKYESFKDFFDDVLSPFGEIGKELFSSDFVFRGENSNTYSLIPSSLRTLKDEDKKLFFQYGGELSEATNEFDQYHYEQAIINRFCKLANQQGLLLPDKIDDFLISLSSTFVRLEPIGEWPSKKQIELFALAQHYGIPTRLLDFTYDKLIALYFAVFTHKSSEYIRLYALRTTELQRFGDKIHFHVPQYAHNPNLSAQKGVLVYAKNIYDFTESESLKMEINREPLDITLTNNFMQLGRVIIPYMYKIDLSKSVIPALKNYLFKMGYFHSRVFPGFTSVKNTMIQENEMDNFSDEEDDLKLIK